MRELDESITDKTSYLCTYGDYCHGRILRLGVSPAANRLREGGGVRGVLKHPSTKRIIQDVIFKLGIHAEECYNCLAEDDDLAAAFARLLLYTDPKPLPSLTSDPGESWEYYLRNWKPGKPHRETFDAFLLHAREAVNGR